MARFSSVLLNLGIVWLAFRIFCEIMPARRKIAFAMALVVVLMPQHTFINSTVGDGPLAEFMACAVLYGWVRLFRTGARCCRDPRDCLRARCSAVLSKATAIFLVPLDAGLALWWLLRQRRQRWSRRRLAYLGIGVAGGGRRRMGLERPFCRRGLTLGVDPGRGCLPPSWLMVDARGITFGQALLASHDSFWAYFGWMAVPVSPRWYGAILLLTAWRR